MLQVRVYLYIYIYIERKKENIFIKVSPFHNKHLEESYLKQQATL